MFTVRIDNCINWQPVSLTYSVLIQKFSQVVAHSDDDERVGTYRDHHRVIEMYLVLWENSEVMNLYNLL